MLHPSMHPAKWWTQPGANRSRLLTRILNGRFSAWLGLPTGTLPAGFDQQGFNVESL